MKKLKEFLSEIGLRILFYLFIGLIIAGVGYFGETMYNELHFGSVLFGVIITIVVGAFIDMRTKD
jgi:hypothetical protein